MITLWLFRAGVGLAEWLPTAWWYRLARLTGLLVSLVPTAQRRRLRANLAQAAGVAESSPALSNMLRRAYQTHAQNYADLLRAQTFRPEEIAERVRSAGGGWDAFLERAHGRRGAVLVTPHFGFIELLSHHLQREGVAVALTVERIQPPELLALVSRQRERADFTIIPHDLGLRPGLRALQRGQVAVYFVDWDIAGNGVPVQLLGRPARLPGGPALAAIRQRVPLFFGYGLPGDDLYHLTAVIEPPLAFMPTDNVSLDVDHLTRRIAERLEACVRQHPEYWVMFHEIWPRRMVECPPEAAAVVARDVPSGHMPAPQRDA